MQRFNKGDHVRYTRSFLRSIGAYFSPMNRAHGVVVDHKDYGTPHEGTQICVIQWSLDDHNGQRISVEDYNDLPNKVSSSNLEKAAKQIPTLLPEIGNVRHESRTESRHDHESTAATANPSGGSR